MFSWPKTCNVYFDVGAFFPLFAKIAQYILHLVFVVELMGWWFVKENVEYCFFI